ncbi:serine/threonine protein kinase [Streptomyces sp. SLBN-118]|uniref:serine/threonine-protein kinase n=1 Tax=Streptomyces sp. SLBN-118 TaxID=2768454 RepID=UPI0011538C49|nr:serine/threonine-protein kinase [Streptomyces sp. SLBN-118]TQK52851.1 serine/threonine protein kinase [Streptomyces sp. SLBN-118]
MEPLAPADPRHIGEYRLLARLGAGGMGQVYLARNDRGRTVAVKLVRHELAEQEEFRGRFRQEVRAALRVGGEWTAPVLDADTEAPVPWVATGYIAGPALQTVVSGDHGPLPERSVRILASGLAHALRNIHAAGLIHRDLKPSNILVTIDGPRVIDFGIARALETVTDGGLTRTGALVGSPGFMAPEQVRGDRVTPACDIFCLGSVLAYAATGRMPFGSADSGVHALMFRIAQEEPDLEGLPQSLLGLVRDCLHKDPEARPTLERILELTTSDATAEPWLPGALIAQLGRHAVQLLEVEQPQAPAPVQPPTMTAPAPKPPVPTPLPTPPPPLPAYGYPHGPAPVTHGPPVPYQPMPAPYVPPPPPRRRGGTIALIAVAVLVAVAAGGAVYAVMGDDGKKSPTDARPGPTTSSPTTPTTPATPAVRGSTAPPTSPGSQEGGVPAEYVGTWEASFATADGNNTRTMTISQGTTGTQVMTLSGTGPNYDCTWSATLQASGPPLELGPTQVTSGDPKQCSPGQWSRLDMPNDTTIVRELVGSGGAPLTYTKSG